MRLLVLLIASLSTLAFAEGTELDAVRAALGELKGTEAVQGTLAVSRWERVSGEKAKEASAGATFFVSASKSGVSVTANEALLAPRAEPKKDAPPDVLGSIVGAVDLTRASRCLNNAGPLLKALETAEVLEDKAATLNDVPCHLLKLKLKTEKQSEGGAEATTERSLTLWLDDQHLPLQTQSVVKSSGGFLVVHFDSTQSTERKFARVGDRLVMVEETEASSATTMGKTFQSKQTAKLTVK